MFVLSALLFFMITPANNKEVKIVFIDGPLETGTVRSIRGCIVKETENSVTIERSNGLLTIGKNFIIKIENWKNNTTRRDFDY